MAFGFVGPAAAAPPKELKVPMFDATGAQPIGQVTIRFSLRGAVFEPNLTGLPPGQHGFHIHENGACGVGAVSAGGHWDPRNTKRHEGPVGGGHRGDLPVLVVADDGTATMAFISPRFDNIAELKGKSLVVDQGGDNYNDRPLPDGGGGTHIACGVIE